jgi:hypothetical protein
MAQPKVNISSAAEMILLIIYSRVSPAITARPLHILLAGLSRMGYSGCRSFFVVRALPDDRKNDVGRSPTYLQFA